jgi:hypothetical protein
MEAVAHNPGFAKKVGIPQSVGKHFHEADKMKRKKFAMGGTPIGLGARGSASTPVSAQSLPPNQLAALQNKVSVNTPYANPNAGFMSMLQNASASPPNSLSQANVPYPTTYPKPLNNLGMKKGGHVKNKKFAEGGKISEFGKAWRAARNDSSHPKTFMFKGKSYTTETAEEAAARKKTDAQRDSDAAAGRQAVRRDETFHEVNTDNRAMKSPGIHGDMTNNIGPSRDPTYDLNNAPTSSRLQLGTNRKLTNLAGGRTATTFAPMSESDSDSGDSLMDNMKKGGKVGMKKGGMENRVANYFAKKGEKGLAAHERREAAGKEKDTKAIAKKEERVLKGAPKSMKDYESKEHKQMGFKGGGAMSKMMKMAQPKAARRPKALPPTGGPAPMGGGIGAMGAMGAMGMKRGGKACGMAKGGGVERKGKTDGKMVKMARGGGIESKGKTRGRFC